MQKFVFKCDSCDENIADINKKCIVCTECFDAFHFNCADVSAKDKSWVCNNCE